MENERLIELVVMARQGDKDAMQTLYLDAYRSVYYLALRMVKNPEDAEDITQEVFITVQEKISELREPAAFYAWVNQITVNKCNYFLRKYKGIAKLDDDGEILELVDDDPMNLPDKAIDDEATRKIILDVIDSLPDGQRVCVMLYYYQQNTISQIADMLETNESTVKTRLSLARAKIRAALEEKEKKEGIKLWGIPLALTPILRQAMEAFTVPEGVAERMWENISKAKTAGASSNGNSGTSMSGTGGAAAANAPAAAAGAAKIGMTLVTKMIIGVVAAAVTAGVIFLPSLFGPSDEPTTPGVTDNTPNGDSTTPGTTDTPTRTPDTEGDLLAANIMATYASLEPTIVGGFDRMNLTISGDVSFELTDISNVILHKDGQSISDTAVFSSFDKMDKNGDTLIYIDFSHDIAVMSGPGVYNATFQYRGQMYCSSSFTWCEGEQPKGISQYDYSTFGPIDGAPNAD